MVLAAAAAPLPQSRYLSGVVDFISLWLSTSNLYSLWTIMALRPPLYLALPAQVYVLGRLTAADFCRAPVRRGRGGGCAVGQLRCSTAAAPARNAGRLGTCAGRCQLQAPCVFTRRASAVLCFGPPAHRRLLPTSRHGTGAAC